MRRVLYAAAIALAFAGGARAQGLEERLRSQLTATVTQLRQLQGDQAILAAQKDAAEKERDELKARVAAAEAKARRVAHPPGPSPADLDKARADQAAQDQLRLDAATAQNQELTRQLSELTAAHDQLVQQAAADGQALKLCRVKHAELTSLAQEVLAAYDRRTGAGLLINREPFTGLARVKAQRRVQAFSDRLYDTRLDIRPKTPASPSAPPKP